MLTKLTFAKFYRYYLREHRNRTCRRLHFFGTSIAVVLVSAALLVQRWELVPLALIQGYLLSWIGHFFFEHNTPATWKHPWLSFLGDWKMWWQMITGEVKI
jgi:hypothetical protein